MLKEQLAMIAADVIRGMREEGWSEDDIKWAACGAILTYCEEYDFDDPTLQGRVTDLQALVKRVLKERPEVICLEGTTDVTPTVSFYYHNVCWNDIYTKPDGYISRVPVTEIAPGTRCFCCQQELRPSKALGYSQESLRG